MQPTIWQQFVSDVAPTLLSLLGTILIAVLTLLANSLKAKFKSDQSLVLLNKVAHLAEMAVLDLKQTLVDEIRKRASDGLLSADDVAEVRELARAKVRAALSTKGINELMKAFGYESEDQVNALISSHIEAAVARARTAVVGGALESIAPPNFGSVLPKID
jgi:hypothetical protein